MLDAEYAALLAATPLQVFDVGARGGLQQHWEGIRQYSAFVGFEPEEREAERLTRSAAPNETYVCAALHGAVEAVDFYQCVVPARSSIYPPNLDVIQEIYGTTESYRIARSERIEATTIDTLVSSRRVAAPDFLKLDTQGSELEILKGATHALDRSVVAIESEVEFLQLYSGQPVFADVDSFLRAHDFVFVGFLRTFTKSDLRQFSLRGETGYANAVEFLSTWASRLVPPHGASAGLSQLIYGDALYFKGVSTLLRYAAAQKDPRVTILKAVLLATRYRAYSYAWDVVAVSSERGLLESSDRSRLQSFITTSSRDVRPLLRFLGRQFTRLARRLRDPQRRRENRAT